MNRAAHHHTFFLSLRLLLSIFMLLCVFFIPQQPLLSSPPSVIPLFLSLCPVPPSLPLSLIPFLSPMPSFPPFPPVSLTTCRSDCHGEDLNAKTIQSISIFTALFLFSLPHAKSADEKQFPCRMKTKMFACANKEKMKDNRDDKVCVSVYAAYSYRITFSA